MAEQLNTFEEPQAENQEHVEEMVAKADALENPPTSDRPEWLPEKFGSAEDMANAYAELEKKLGQPKDKVQVQSETPPPEVASVEAAQEELEKRGINFDKLSQEFAKKGKLSDQAYKQLEKAGISRDLTNQFIQGQAAVATQMQSEAFGLVGGQDQYTEMVTWAADNLPDAAISTFNRAVNSGNKETVHMAIQGLSAQYRSANGSEPTLVRGTTNTKAGGVFESAAQLTAAMRDPRYSTDPAYRQEVAVKLQRSSVF